MAMSGARHTIAGLSGAVVVAMLVFAAIRLGFEAVAGVVTFVTCGILLLAIVGAVCRHGARRAAWLGFALFGAGYLAVVYVLGPEAPEFPTAALTTALASRFGVSAEIVERLHSARLAMLRPGTAVGDEILMIPEIDTLYWWFAHCLWSLGLGLAGMLLAGLLFDSWREPIDNSNPERKPNSAGKVRWRQWPGAAVTVLSALVVITSLALLLSGADLVRWIGATILLTLAILGLAVLGAVYSRGKRRARWLGASLFGLGYLTLVMVAGPELQGWPDRVIDALSRVVAPVWRVVVRGKHESTSKNVFAANARANRAFERRASFPFDVETPLEDVLKYVRRVAIAPDGRMIEIYVDPIGLREVEKTLWSTVPGIEFDDVPVEIALRILLAQIDLAYRIRDGVVIISSAESNARFPWSVSYLGSYTLACHCLLALIAAGFGAIAAAKAWSADRATDATPSRPAAVSDSRQSRGTIDRA
jgi:hypothetical protein